MRAGQKDCGRRTYNVEIISLVRLQSSVTVGVSRAIGTVVWDPNLGLAAFDE